MRFVIPTSFTFPGGYSVKVVQLPPAKYFRNRNRKATKASTTCGDKIYLNLERTPAQRRADFVHELGHNYLDWQSTSLNRCDVEAKG